MSKRSQERLTERGYLRSDGVDQSLFGVTGLVVPGRVVIITPAGTEAVPAVLRIYGDWVDAYDIDMLVVTDVPSSDQAPHTTTAITAALVAIDYAAIVNALTDVTATAVGETVEVLAAVAELAALLSLVAALVALVDAAVA